MSFNEDIFIIDCWLDTDSKEQDLIKLIGVLKQFEIPILLTGHYEVKLEIQKMVDYYLYDKDNPIIRFGEYENYGVASGRWSKMGKCRIDNGVPFHHDYAIWKTMQNSFSFANTLGKKYIHFFEYDCLPDPVQYRQAFLEYSRTHDAVVYKENWTKTPNYYNTYIFSMKTEIAMKMVSTVNSMREYFENRPDGWNLEAMFYKYLHSVTNDVFLSKYIPNNNEFNTQAVWNRNGIFRNNEKIQVYLGVDRSEKLYIHIILGFAENPATKGLLLEITYGNGVKFYDAPKDCFTYFELGQYKKGETVTVYHNGVEVYKELLDKNYDDFWCMNKVTFDDEIVVTKPDDTLVETVGNVIPPKNRKLNIHFIDGPFVEILEDTKEFYNVQFFNSDLKKIEYSLDLETNHWAKAATKYFTNWQVIITGKMLNYTHVFSLVDKRVLISFESKSIGDTLAWLPYVEEFRVKHGCHVICSTFHNNLFKDEYPEIEFIRPGSIAYDLTATYRIGIFFKDGTTEYDPGKHPIDPKTVPLQKVATDILGLEYKEIIPRIKEVKFQKKKRVTIGVHATAQCKYWNNPNGWQEVTDYLKNRGYEVLILSKERNGYMNNFHPKGAVQYQEGNLEDAISKIKSSDMFIGLSSGLSWLSWACKVPTILISGFTTKDTEPSSNIYRVINENVCHGCWSTSVFDPGDWNWCPYHKDTDGQFQCTKTITSDDVIKEIEKIIGPNLERIKLI